MRRTEIPRFPRNTTKAGCATAVVSLVLSVGAESIAVSGCGNNDQQPGSDAAPSGGDSQPPADSSTGDGVATDSGGNAGDAADDAIGEADVPLPPPPPDPVISLSTGTLKLEVWGPRTIRVLYGLPPPTPGASFAVNETRP